MNCTHAIRNLALTLILAASAFSAPAVAQIRFTVAPPAPQYEIVPAIAPGQVWAPGYWALHGERHVWIRGRPIVQREGYRWEPDRWEQRDQSYHHSAGHWKRDAAHQPVKVKKAKKAKKQKSSG